MMAHSEPGRVAKLVTVLVVHARIWSTMLWCGLQQAGTLHVHNVGNRLLVAFNEGIIYLRRTSGSSSIIDFILS